MEGLQLRQDRYNQLATRNRQLVVFLVISLCALLISSALNWKLMNGYEIRTGYFILGEDDRLVALNEAKEIARDDHRVIRSFLEDFVMDAFRVSVDRNGTKASQEKTMARVCKNARARMNDFYDLERNPFSSLVGWTVELERPSLRILPVGDSGEVWSVEVTEVHRERGGLERKMEVKLTVTLDYEGDEVSAREGLNVLGIWVSEMHMERFVVRDPGSRR